MFGEIVPIVNKELSLKISPEQKGQLFMAINQILLTL